MYNPIPRLRQTVGRKIRDAMKASVEMGRNPEQLAQVLKHEAGESIPRLMALYDFLWGPDDPNEFWAIYGLEQIGDVVWMKTVPEPTALRIKVIDTNDQYFILDGVVGIDARHPEIVLRRTGYVVRQLPNGVTVQDDDRYGDEDSEEVIL